MAQALVFDLDGTLVDSATPITVALNELRARRGGGPLPKRQTREWVSLGATQLVINALGRMARDPVADVAEFREIYGAIRPSNDDLFPGVGATLRQLASAGATMSVCTNKPEHLARNVVEGVGIANFFRALVGGRAGLAPKPDPAPLREAMTRIGAAPGDALYIGDSEVDAEAAAALGAPFVLATFGYAIGDVRRIPCVAHVDRFGELPTVLRRITTSACA